MANILETLFGPDKTPGGKPGKVGEAMATAQAVVRQVPIVGGIATALPEFFQNPQNFLDDYGRPDLLSLLVPQHRDARQAERETMAQVQRLETTRREADFAKEFLFGPNSGMSPAEGAQRGREMGLNETMLGSLQNRDYAQGQQAKGARDTAQALGYPAEVAQHITPEQIPGVFNTAVDNARADASAAAANDRANRRLSLAEGAAARRAAREAAAATGGGGAAAGPGGAMPLKTASERNGFRNLTDLRRRLRKNEVPDWAVPQAKSIVKTKNGQQAYNLLTQIGQTSRPSTPTQIMSNPAFKDASERVRAAQAARAGLADLERQVLTPDGAGIDPTLFSPAMAAFLPDSAAGQSLVLSMLGEERGGAKQNAISTAAKNLGDYVLRMTGKVSNVNELERLKTVAPTANEATGLLFQRKMAAFDRALAREAAIAEREAESIGMGMESGKWRETIIRDEYDGILRDLVRDLTEAESDPEAQPVGPLSPEEMAELERYRANR